MCNVKASNLEIEQNIWKNQMNVSIRTEIEFSNMQAYSSHLSIGF